MGFIQRFHEIYNVERAGISLASSCRALTRPNAMEGLVVVSYAKQLHLITSKARIKWLLRGEGNELTERIYINCGIIFNHGKYYSLRN